MSLTPFLTVPILMEAGSTTSKGYVAGESGATGLSPIGAPFLYNGALYAVLQAVGLGFLFVPPSGIYVYTSLDDGATWAALDAANGPARVDETPIASFVFDGADTIVVAFSPNGGPLTAGVATISLQNFDLITGTWGAVYGTVGSPAVARIQVDQLFVRPDASLLLLTSRTVSGINPIGLIASIFSGGAWSAPVTVDSGLSGTFVSNGQAAACMDSAGRVHVFGVARDGGSNQELFYQMVKADNTLGAFAVIQTGSPNLPGQTQNLEPAISGDNVVVGLNDPTGTAYATIAVGTPLSAAVFTVLGSPGIDPSGPGGTVVTLVAPDIAVDATGIYAAYIVRTGGNNAIVRLCFNPNITTPLVGWNESILAYDTTTSGLTGSMQFLGIFRDGGELFGTFNGTAAGAGQPSQYWLGAFAPEPEPAAPFRLALYGYKLFRNRPVCAPDLVELPVLPPPKRVL